MMTHLLIATIVFCCAIGSVGFAHASGALEQMKQLLVGEENVPQEVPPQVPVVLPSETGSGCGPEAVLPVEICEIGQGTLCINTPPFSVDEDIVIIKGTVDRRTSAFSHLKLFVQHEYTKVLHEVQVENWASSGCWEESWVGSSNACLDSRGFFAVKVPLSDPGPYTIMIDAVTLDGEAVSGSKRTSRVVAPLFSAQDITVTPDPSISSGVISASKVQLHVDLLHECVFCDLIGASTGGVMITVKNNITTPEGGQKQVIRKGNISFSGKFDVCVPVLTGTNNLTVTACNAAVEGDCPTVSDVSFNVASSGSAVTIVSPDPSTMFYDAVGGTTIPLKFRIDGRASEECHQGDVTVNWNRQAPVSVCPDAEGFYTTMLMPDVGINVGTIDHLEGSVKKTHSFVLAYGSAVDPYKDDTSGWITRGAGLSFGAGYLNDTLRPLINEFLNSEELLDIFDDIALAGGGAERLDNPAEETMKREKIAAIRRQIDGCKVSTAPDTGIGKIALVGRPDIGEIDLKRFDLNEKGVGFKLDLANSSFSLKMYDDVNSDGVPDKDPLPLLLSFKKVRLEGRIMPLPGGLPLFLISSDSVDCDFVNGAYCKDQPAILLPRNIVGNATRAGHFVRCDDKNQTINEDVRDSCEDINVLNSITGAVSSKVLSAVNDMIYCDGSAELTYALREKLSNFDSEISLPMGRKVSVGGGIKADKAEIKIDENGVRVFAPARFGGVQSLSNLDRASIESSYGVIVDPVVSAASWNGIDPETVGFSASTGWLNELLFQITFQREGRGLLDWELDEEMFDGLGFDFVSSCDAFESTPEVQKPSALCQLRPRVGELLGSVLSSNGYFTAKQPIRVSIKGNRKLGPFAKIYRADVPYELPPEPGDEEIRYEYRPAKIFELQIPDVQVAFYALEINESAGKDAYGNPQVLMGDDGKAVVHSMIDGAVPPVPIIRTNMTVILALEMQDLRTSPSDTSQLILNIRPIPEFTKIVFSNLAGANATAVPDESLISAFKEKLTYGVEIFGDPDAPLSIKIPKVISLGVLEEADPYGIMEKLGLGRLDVGRDGLELVFDDVSDMIHFNMKPRFD